MSHKVLSVFIDESGDFGAYDKNCPFYIVTMLFHDQSINIADDISAFKNHMRTIGYNEHAVHAGPLIRRESVYRADMMETRKKLFNSMFHFVRKTKVVYDCIFLYKREEDVISMTSRLSKLIKDFVRKNEVFLSDYENVIVYYDNGQIELTKILTSVLTALIPNIEFRKVKPIDYILFQAADMICTLELVNKKFEMGVPSRSETEFFHDYKKFYKNYMKSIYKKKK